MVDEIHLLTDAVVKWHQIWNPATNELLSSGNIISLLRRSSGKMMASSRSHRLLYKRKSHTKKQKLARKLESREPCKGPWGGVRSAEWYRNFMHPLLTLLFFLSLVLTLL